jgi:hypothetical protein
MCRSDPAHHSSPPVVTQPAVFLFLKPAAIFQIRFLVFVLFLRMALSQKRITHLRDTFMSPTS